MEALLYWAGAVVLAGGALGALGALWRWVVRPVASLIRRVREFLDDWAGEPARSGVPARPGVMERLAHIERHVGNGKDPPLREFVEGMAEELAQIKGRRVD